MAVGKVIGANLKFHQPLRQGGLRDYLKALVAALAEIQNRKTVVRVFPHDLALLSLRKDHGLGPFIEGAGAIELGSQDIHPVEDGSFTRAPMSPQDLKSLVGLKHTLGGHSETVVYFGVKDGDVAKKLDAALRTGIYMTVCLGVMPDVVANSNDGGKSALAKQVEDRIIPALTDAYKDGESNFDIAWEPVAAIKGFAELWGLPAVPPSDADIVNAHEVVRQALNDHGFQNIADTVRISYGGSANEKNAGQLLGLPGVDGLLVGTAAWEVAKLTQMIQAAELIG